MRADGKGDVCPRMGESLRLCIGRACAMPRQRTHDSRRTYVFPDDFPRRLERFKEESGLSWAELARRLGTSTLNLRRWKDKGVRPNWWRCWSWPKSWA